MITLSGVLALSVGITYVFISFEEHPGKGLTIADPLSMKSDIILPRFFASSDMFILLVNDEIEKYHVSRF